jgi:hypothetical protein
MNGIFNPSFVMGCYVCSMHDGRWFCDGEVTSKPATLNRYDFTESTYGTDTDLVSRNFNVICQTLDVSETQFAET